MMWVGADKTKIVGGSTQGGLSVSNNFYHPYPILWVDNLYWQLNGLNIQKGHSNDITTPSNEEEDGTLDQTQQPDNDRPRGILPNKW